MRKKIQAKYSKLSSKLRRKKDDLPLRVTNETVVEHREHVLKSGKKFKYPMQYVKHRLVYNTLILSFSTIILLLIFGWYQMYINQNSSTFFYNVSKVLPLPAASIDGETAPLRNYLMKYRSAVYYLENKEQVSFANEEGKRQIDYIKQQSMSDALADAYAAKLARKANISVTQTELDDYISAQRKSINGTVSEQTYESVIDDYYGWSYDDYVYAMKTKLLRQKVAYHVDEVASGIVQSITPEVKASSNFKALVESYNATTTSRKIIYGDAGWVPKTNNDGGLAKAASSMTKGQISDAIKSSNGDGYYFLYLNDISDADVNYRFIKVPLGTFSDNFDNLESTKVTYYIKIPEKEKTNE